MKNEIVNHLKKCAAYHTGLGEREVAKSKLCKAAAQMCHKISDESLGDVFASLAEEHADSAALHAAHAKHHVELCEKIQSGAIDLHDDSQGVDELRAAAGSGTFGMTATRDFSKIKPDGAHGVLPSARLINRVGGAPLPGDSEDDATQQLDKAILGT